MKKSILTFMAIIMLGCVLSVNEASAFHWGQKAKITGVYVYADNPAFITTESNENPDNCANSRYLVLMPTSQHFNQLYATALAAQLSGQIVSVTYDGCSGHIQ